MKKKCKRCGGIVDNLEKGICKSCLEMARKRICYACGQPIVGHSINGKCQTCYIVDKAEEEKHDLEVLEGNDLEGLVRIGAVQPMDMESLMEFIDKEHNKLVKRWMDRSN